MSAYRLKIDLGPHLLGVDRLTLRQTQRLQKELRDQTGIEFARRKTVLTAEFPTADRTKAIERQAAELIWVRTPALLSIEWEAYPGFWHEVQARQLEPKAPPDDPLAAAIDGGEEPVVEDQEPTLEEQIEIQRKAGWAQWVVSMRLPSRAEARAARNYLQGRGVPSVVRGKRVMVGGATEEHAHDLSTQLRAELPAAGAFEIRRGQPPSSAVGTGGGGS